MDEETMTARAAAVAELHRSRWRWNRKVGREYCLLCIEEAPCQTVRIIDDTSQYTKHWLAARDKRIRGDA